jgi:hypothetical protein
VLARLGELHRTAGERHAAEECVRRAREISVQLSYVGAGPRAGKQILVRSRSAR